MDRQKGLAGFARRLPRAWSEATASTWTADNPALGQCSVTALAAHRLFGGELLKTRTDDGTHFYNRIGGVRIDFTSAQFSAPIDYDDAPADPAEALADTSPDRLVALLAALEEEE